MSNLTPKQQKLIAQEIETWTVEKLIGEELSATLLARYPLKEQKANVSGALSLIGSILVGLGALLFIASNWQHMAVGIKLLVIVTATIAAQYFGWRFKFEPGNRPKLGSALLILGCLFYGGGIWLIAQIFNIDTNFADGILLWAIGTLATTLVVRTVPLACLSSILLAFWAFAKLDFAGSTDPTKLMQLVYFFISFGTSTAIARMVKSRAVTWIALLTGGAWMLVWSATNQALLLWGLATFGTYLWHRERQTKYASPFLYVSTASFLGSLLFATFDSYRHTGQTISQIAVPLFITVSVLLITAWKLKRFKNEAIIALMLAIAGCLTYGYAEGAVKITSNILLLATIVGLIYTGLNRIQSAGLVNVAIVFFVFDVISRYFDFFFSMMDRSMFFIIGGVILMIVGSFAESSRRKLVEGLSQDPPPEPGLAT